MGEQQFGDPMTKKNTPTTLSDIQVFSALSKAELRSMCRLMAAVNVKEGRLLTREGEPGREFMIILEGQATVRRKGKLLATLSPGDFFGELSIIAGVPRMATVTADTDMVLEALNRREFLTLLDENPRIARKVLVGAVKRLHHVDSGLAD
ncbi:MAG TPA: cyclic nucleotide-binding domain-containing protein [Acidimicrobiia bacterium]|jgi:CRP-like cAMP-binding protein|nr:cyclic nucleotide-binding domain-containing protein [Acidimicrobiia bacterium]HIL45981.1 cyclic nucleotide-binding domain-containing protein [Acidimicrobiia bacterium]